MHRQHFVEAYEDLRAEVINGPAEVAQRSAVALFARGGMVEWMRVWSHLSPTDGPAATLASKSVCRATFQLEELASLSADRAEATVLLAGMVMANLF